MTIGDGSRNGDHGDGAGADEVPATGSDDSAPDHMAHGRPLQDAEVRGDEVVDAEIVDWPDDAVADAADAVEADPLEVAQAERDEYLDSLRRLQAEFENYKKRVLKQQTEQVARAAAGLVDKLLPVLDALDLATDHVGDADSAEGKALVAANGLLHGVLAKEGLERIDPLGEEFDPNAHEAVGQVPAPEGADPTASGEPRVAQVMRAGYRWHGTVVRPAMVMVES
ncbi:MAG TPA: nucleotide exchange factor GrpE [Acidimicrobiales bacterium]